MDQMEPVVPPKNHVSLRAAALGGAIIVVLAGLGVVAWKVGHDARDVARKQQETIDGLTASNTSLQNALANQGAIVPGEPTGSSEGNNLEKPPVSEAPVQVTLGGTLHITWLPPERQTDRESLPAFARAFGYINPEYGTQERFARKSFPLGTVNGGAYDGYDLVAQQLEEEGMGGNISMIYVLLPHSPLQKAVVVDRYLVPSNWYNLYKGENAPALSLFTPQALQRLGGELVFDASIRIPELERGLIYTDAKGNQFRVVRLIGHEPNYFANAFSKEQRGSFFTVTQDTAKLPVFEVNGSFYGMREDGRPVVLTFIPPTTLWDTSGEQSQVPQITWKNDGSKNDAQFYRGVRGGCGFVSDAAIVSESDIGPMAIVATFMDNGKSVNLFVPTDKKAAIWEQLGTQVAYDDKGNISSTLYPYDKAHSVFLYKDALGRWNRFLSPDFGPQAECGKPVIYLYPPTATDVSVHLAPQGGFTKSEPAYGNGWNVHASPDGTLVTQDGATYPYLFWEGRGGHYEFPSGYWVVERSDVEPFLKETLEKVGLNGKETADFMEFWLPRMQHAPWYKIGFHGTSVMDGIAPMQVSPAPDSRLRVLMDYAELQAPEASHPPLIHPFLRKGFSVVEWGGVLSK